MKSHTGMGIRAVLAEGSVYKAAAPYSHLRTVFCFCHFKDAKRMQRKSRNLSRSVQRLKLLETYSQELLKADAKVSQSEDVIQFFKAQTQDLDPSFPENSIIIMPSEMGDGKKDQPKQQNPSVTQPVVSQSYSCIEAYETKDTKNRPFKVAKKEIVEVLIKDMTGWWLVENKDQQIAWFPAPYLEERGTGEESLGSATSSRKADELSLNVGVVVEVLEKSDNEGPTSTVSPLALASPILSSLLVFPLPSMAAPPQILSLSPRSGICGWYRAPPSCISQGGECP
uniref:SH3 domain-containing protein n=1 Tax=Chelydra serpentina TaxID=8475 RepID=A0A8C3SI98_CHESE